MMQLNMFDMLDPKPVMDEEELLWYQRPTYTVLAPIRGEMKEVVVTEGEPEPIQVSVMGIPCVIEFCGLVGGFSTHAVEKFGTPFWSESGFRSWAGSCDGITDGEELASLIEEYIRAPKGKDGMGGLNGELKPWWPSFATQWRDHFGFVLSHGRDRSKLWAQWGEEKHREIWAETDANFEARLADMKERGIDPNALGKPKGYKGKWPTVHYGTKLSEFSQ